jgi:hypothetical protein
MCIRDSALWLRRWIFIIACAAVFVATALVYNQMNFASSTFELGTTTELSGQLIVQPFPFLRVRLETDTDGREWRQDVLLVSMGKFGAEKAIRAYEKKYGVELNGREVTIQGSLIYHDGKVVLELTRLAKSIVAVDDVQHTEEWATQDLGKVALMGEIADPKCLLGVMRPGWGKPHRSCAARCLAGGIPPLLRVESGGTPARYCLLLDAEGNPLGARALPWVAKPVFACGRLQKRGEWYYLWVDPEQDLRNVPASIIDVNDPRCR